MHRSRHRGTLTPLVEKSFQVTLAEVRPGELVLVREVHGSGAFRRRLLELGLVPGTSVTRTGQSPLGDPLVFRVRGAILGVRRTDASVVEVERP